MLVYKEMNKNLRTIGLDDRRIDIINDLISKLNSTIPIGHRITLLVVDPDGKHSRILEDVYHDSLPPKYMLHYSGYFVYIIREKYRGDLTRTTFTLYYKSHTSTCVKIGRFYTSIESADKRDEGEIDMTAFDPFYNQNQGY